MLPASTHLPLVLDTNVVLDWLVFRDPSSRPVEAAIRLGQVRWSVTAAMRLETERVLTYKYFASHSVDRVAVFSTWEAFAETIDPSPPCHPIRCAAPIPTTRSSSIWPFTSAPVRYSAAIVPCSSSHAGHALSA